jgi:competence protein ComGC
MRRPNPASEQLSSGRAFRSYFTLRELLAVFIIISALLAIRSP